MRLRLTADGEYPTVVKPTWTSEASVNPEPRKQPLIQDTQRLVAVREQFITEVKEIGRRQGMDDWKAIRAEIPEYREQIFMTYTQYNPISSYKDLLPAQIAEYNQLFAEEIKAGIMQTMR